MSASVLRKIRGSVIIASNLRGQRRIPFWPRERLEALRDKRVRRIVRHAARNVPYYRDMFSREKIDPREINTASDLEKLPILDKRFVRENPRLFLSTNRQSSEAIRFLTSGTTGAPAEIFHDRHSLLANIPYGERERDPLIRICGSFRPKELYIGYENSTFKTVMDFYSENALMPIRPQRTLLSIRDPIERIAAATNELQPDILVGYGGWMNLFFKTVARQGLELHPLQMALYMGESLPPGARNFIESHFKIPVLSRYNAVEAFKIGFFCEQQSGFHIHEDLCHLRIVDPEGRRAPPGIQGSILISNLVNTASVLLNYPIGDTASFVDATCSCGRSFRIITELEGRIEDILTLSNGIFVHPRSVWQVFKGDPEILQYQLIQHEQDLFELAIATATKEAFDRAYKRALPDLQSLLGSDSVIEAHRKVDLGCTPGAKFRAVEVRVK